MAYTVKQLAELSGISVRTLHFYDEIGLLKPAFHGGGGYRYYEEQELLTLQQILFYRELGFELKKIQKILGRGDFDKIAALHSHRVVLMQELKRIQQLVKTIDKTIDHMQGSKKMTEQELYWGFNPEKQAEHEESLIKRLGDKGKRSIAESHKKTKGWTKADWTKSQVEYDALCKELVEAINKGLTASSTQVQSIIRKHYKWVKKFWTPTQESYEELGILYCDDEWRKIYDKYNPKLAPFLAEAMKVFATSELA